MKKMTAGSFKAKCLVVIDEVQANGEAVLITKYGKPVAKLVPVNEEPDDIFDFFAGKGVIVGDLVSPALSAEEWGKAH
jgi:prevent-host-death family protein